ncbi:MAG: FtsX-like permease family protein [Deltaproteobacteria bacterium]|jgi:ABC-type antimicrobial peptide transport system permease subunit|nr:FtsX-like permease family protein [Deltaproteobacteria bacterium]MBW2479284.1 FtsX-like permease family protein [Deltaproteobacteria bacterium]
MPAEKILSESQNDTGQVQRQVKLPFLKSVEISIKSIKVRFFRSLITTMSLVLAVSFLSFVGVSNDIANGMLAKKDPELRRQLENSGYDLKPGDLSVGSSPKQRWLVILSLLVCVVGIVNAQLMAVTERFREIGTMKCLGALDRFILRLFILEAGIQGLAGAGLGALLGAVFSLFNGWLRFGLESLKSISLTSLVVSILIATGVGCLLSLLGVFYPALIAARMQPVEAMRVEQ